jgi:hypothetical protein
VRHAVLVIAVLGCRVPDIDLDGKQCPCAAGYVCQDSTSTCVRALDDAGTGDATIDGRIDPASCLSSPFGTLIYETEFDTPDDWPAIGGSWTIADGEMHQSDENAALAFAYHDVGGALDYRIVSRIQMLTGGDGRSIAVSARIPGGASAQQYHCNWGPTDGVFSLVRSDGLSTFTLKATMIDLTAIPEYVPTQPATIELQVQGNQLACCLREHAGARLTAVDGQFPVGHPGAKTDRMAGGYDNYRVYRAP